MNEKKKGSKMKAMLPFILLAFTNIKHNLCYEMSWHFMDFAVLGKHKLHIYKGFTWSTFLFKT